MISKRIMLLFLAIILSFGGMAAAAGATLPQDRGEANVNSIRFFGQAARSLRDYDEGNTSYISSITLTLDSDIMVVNGEEVNVASPYMAEGKELLLPITDIAEALGAEVDVDDAIGEITIADDGDVTVLDTPPDVENYQLYDVQEVADVLTLDYFIDGDDIVLTRPFQSKMLLVRMQPGKKLSGTYGAAKHLTDGHGHYVLKYDSISEAKNAYDLIKDLPDCENVAPNLMFFVFDTPSVIEYAMASLPTPNWGSARIHADLMKNHLEVTGKTGTEIIVAVIDTGVQSNHPHLEGRLKPGCNFAANPRNDNTADTDGHGTHVAGIVVDCTPENVKILPAKVVNNSGIALRSDVADAIVWAVESGAKVINMSIGFTNVSNPPEWDREISDACDIAVSHDVAVVAAAGNITPQTPEPIDTKYVSPARLSSVITVTATDKEDQGYSEAFFGESIDVAAPGVSIMSSWRNNGYATLSGTSMAAPHAAAAVAMLSLNNPILDYEGLKEALISICVDLGDPGKDIYYGNGIIDFDVLFDHEHEWGTGVVTAPTCAEQGYTTYKCIHCELTDKRDIKQIDPDNHNYIAGTPVAPTCTEQGYTTYTCTWCGNHYDADYVNATGHTWGEWTTRTAATCSATGVEYHTCSVCNEEETGIAPINPDNHNYVAGTPIAPTCTSQGYTTYTCTWCGNQYDADFVAELDHEWSNWVTRTAATCSATGVEYRTCSVCNKEETGSIPINPDNHNYVAGTPVAPTCTVQGYTTYTCTWCGNQYDADFVAVLDHEWSNWVTRTAATCAATGVEYRTCSVGNEEETRIAPIDPTAHIWDSGVVTTQPTVNSEGVRTFTCTLCGDTRTETIAALPAQSVSVGAQSGTLTAGKAGTVTFTVTTVNIASGSYEAAVTNLPNGVSVQGQVSILNNSGTLTLSGTASIAAGKTENLVLTINNVASPGFTLTISTPQVDIGTPSFGGGTVVTNNDEPDEVEIEDPEVPITKPGGFSAFINGYPDKTFRGADIMSREEFINILFKLSNPYGLPAADASKPSFNDVAPGRWSYNAIEWAVSAGIIEADNSEGNFHPGEPLTRAMMAVMLVKMEEWTETADNIFSDIDDHPYLDAILKATKAGIFVGYPDGTFKPDETAVRVEVVTALVRYLLGGEPTDEMWTDISVALIDIPRSHWAYKYVALATTGYAMLPQSALV